jgi:hypothetical protein
LIPKGTTILTTGINKGRPFIQLNQKVGTSDNPSGIILTFKTPIDDYAVTDITKLWYAWANYYVTNVFTSYPTTVTASAAYKPPSNTAMPQNVLLLSSVPTKPLLVGTTVSDNNKGGIRPGTTILGIRDQKGNPIGSAKQVGDQICFLRRRRCFQSFSARPHPG